MRWPRSAIEELTKGLPKDSPKREALQRVCAEIEEHMPLSNREYLETAPALGTLWIFVVNQGQRIDSLQRRVSELHEAVSEIVKILEGAK